MDSDVWFEGITNSKDFWIALLLFVLVCVLPALFSHWKGYGFFIGFFGALITNPVHMMYKLFDWPSLRPDKTKEKGGKGLLTNLLTHLAYKAGSLLVKLINCILTPFGVTLPAPLHRETSSFYLNQEYLSWAYDHLLNSSADEIKLAFPGGKAQMGEIIIEILSLCRHDPDKCTWQIYMRAVQAYFEIINNHNNQQYTSEMLYTSYRDIVHNQEAAIKLIELFENA